MLNEDACVATTRTLLFSGTTGILGAGAAVIGEQICNMSMWDDIQLIKLIAASGIGNALLGLPVGACYALANLGVPRRQNYRDWRLEKKSLIWVTITGGLGSLAGASLLCLVDNNAQGISAASIGMVGGLVIGVCTACIGGISYAITACQSGQRVGLGRVIVSEAGAVIHNNERLPLLHDLEAVDPAQLNIQEALPTVAEVSGIIENRLGIPVEAHAQINREVIDEDDEKMVDVDLNDTPPSSPRAEERAGWCRFM